MNYTVTRCHRWEVKEFIETWHYSHSINGLSSDYCFKLMDGDELIGGMIYGKLAMANCWKTYAKRPEDIIELRRLCCIDDTPKNTESYFISRTLKWLQNNTDLKKVISYADNTYHHTGIIYQASNFEHVGKTALGKVIMYKGKQYHDKTIRTRHNGKLKPFAREIKEALKTGEAYYVYTLGKDIYIYDLEAHRSCKQIRANRNIKPKEKIVFEQVMLF